MNYTFYFTIRNDRFVFYDSSAIASSMDRDDRTAESVKYMYIKYQSLYGNIGIQPCHVTSFVSLKWLGEIGSIKSI